ncbi:MAG: hypothetical protein SWY16_11410 [Cyanobacteriota bacterium]|nr:hypothetical protein [Cyanobacteriota bacterium]
MFKFDRMFSSLLIAMELVVVTYSYGSANTGVSVSQNPPRSHFARQFSLSDATKEAPRPPGNSGPGGGTGVQEPRPPRPPGESGPGGGLGWQQILPLEPPKEGEITGTRSRGGFCPIAPSGFGSTQVVWNDRPLFVWNEVRANVTRVEVRDSDDMENSTLLWSVEPTENKVQYDGEALEPGQTYYWMVFFNGASAPTLAIPFELSADRDRIAAELAALELPEDASEEDIARIRAAYFNENGLPSDALQEALSVSEPSKELEEILEALPAEYCQEPEEE